MMIKCTATLHPTCQSLDILFNRSKHAAAHAYQLCRNHTLINYASGLTFVLPFVRAYYILSQFRISVELDFFAKMKLKKPGLLEDLHAETTKSFKTVQITLNIFKYTREIIYFLLSNIYSVKRRMILWIIVETLHISIVVKHRENVFLNTISDDCYASSFVCTTDVHRLSQCFCEKYATGTDFIDYHHIDDLCEKFVLLNVKKGFI